MKILIFVSFNLLLFNHSIIEEVSAQSGDVEEESYVSVIDETKQNSQSNAMEKLLADPLVKNEYDKCNQAIEQKSELATQLETWGIERFQGFLLITLLVLVISELIPDRIRVKSSAKRGTISGQTVVTSSAS